MLFLAAAPTLAAVTPSSTEIFIGGKSGTSERLRIYNHSDDIAYVKIGDVYRVTNPGTGQQSESVIDNVNMPEVIVTPRQLVIQPRSDMDIVVYDMFQDRGVEAAYYFKVEQLVPPVTGKININLAYRVLVRASPNESNPSFFWEVNHDHVVLKNRGNVRLAFKDAKLCKREDPQSCYPLEIKNFRLYPGLDKKISINSGYQLHLLQVYPVQQMHVIK